MTGGSAVAIRSRRAVRSTTMPARCGGGWSLEARRSKPSALIGTTVAPARDRAGPQGRVGRYRHPRRRSHHCVTTTQPTFSSTPSSEEREPSLLEVTDQDVEVHPEEAHDEGDREEHRGDGGQLPAGRVLTVAGEGRVEPQQAEAPIADGGEVGDDQPELVQHVVGVEQALVGGAGQRHDDRRASGHVATGGERPPQPVGPAPDRPRSPPGGSPAARRPSPARPRRAAPPARRCRGRTDRAGRSPRGGGRGGDRGAEQPPEGPRAVELVEGLAGLLAEGDEEPGRDVGVDLDGVAGWPGRSRTRSSSPRRRRRRACPAGRTASSPRRPDRAGRAGRPCGRSSRRSGPRCRARTACPPPRAAATSAGIGVLDGDVVVLEPGPHDRVNLDLDPRANHPPWAMASTPVSS